MEAGHTAGPWTWWTSNSFVRLTGADGKDGGVLGACLASDGHACINVKPADAKLIAAAPDLLGFAQFVLRGLESGHVKSKPFLDFGNPNAASLEIQSLHSLARAVIAKASAA
jgi:hypothetical protein